MYKILKNKLLAPNIYLMDVHAPRVASSALPGQFVIVRTGELGERIPLTVCDYDREKGTVTIVVQVVGASSRKICSLKEGDGFTDFVGPLGHPSEFVNEDDATLRSKRRLFIAGGVGAAPVYPQVKWLQQRGAQTDVIIGGRSKDFILLEEDRRRCARISRSCNRSFQRACRQRGEIRRSYSHWSYDNDEIRRTCNKRIRYQDHSLP